MPRVTSRASPRQPSFADPAWPSRRRSRGHQQTEILTTGGSKGFVGVAVQPVHLPEAHRTGGRERGLLVVGVTPGGPADAAGVIVGDLLLDFAGAPIESAEDLLDRLTGDRVGQRIQLRTLHGGLPRDVEVAVASRPRA